MGNLFINILCSLGEDYKHYQPKHSHIHMYMDTREVKNTVIRAQSLVFNAAHETAVKLEEIRNQHLKEHRESFPLCCVGVILHAQCARANADKEWDELNRIMSS